MVIDDGDIVRGLGFVSMYSAWVEEDVDDILRGLNDIEPFTVKVQRWMISRKLEYSAAIINNLKSPELIELPNILRSGVQLFEERNQLIHGRIYAGFDRKDYVRSGRIGNPVREIISLDLYDLANKFFSYRGELIGPQLFRIPRAVDAELRRNKGC